MTLLDNLQCNIWRQVQDYHRNLELRQVAEVSPAKIFLAQPEHLRMNFGNYWSQDTHSEGGQQQNAYIDNEAPANYFCEYSLSHDSCSPENQMFFLPRARTRSTLSKYNSQARAIVIVFIHIQQQSA